MNREYPGNFQKQISKLPFQLSVQVYSLLGQTEGERKVFSGGCKKKGGCIVRLSPRALCCHKKWKVYPFVKFEIIVPLLCCLLDPLKNRHDRTWSSMINWWIDSRTCQKYRILLSARQRSNKLLRAFKRKCFWEYDAVTLTMIYLKILHDMVSQNS